MIIRNPPKSPNFFIKKTVKLYYSCIVLTNAGAHESGTPGAECVGTAMSDRHSSGDCAASGNPPWVPLSQTTDWSEMELTKFYGTELEWSTIQQGSRDQRAKKKYCLFCGLGYTGGPSFIRIHLDPRLKPRQVPAPLPRYLQYHDRCV